MDPKWLAWAKALQAIAQTGLTYTEDPFDIERYQAIRGIATEIVAQYTSVSLKEVGQLFAVEVGHATPKVDVRGVVFGDDCILLVREKRDGLWTLPGGWADVDQSPSEAVVREVYEESGYRVRTVKLLALYDMNKHPHPPHLFHIYKLLFLCELLGGSPADSLETEGASFFKEDEIPELSLSRVLPSQIRRLFEHHRHPEWPTDFD